jgi:hypothetical protein
MCRYSWHNYKDHFACFDCRKAFKQWQWEATDEDEFNRRQKLKHVPREVMCPDCGESMTDMGLDFKAPRQNDVEAWEVLRVLSEHGFRFFGCGCSVGFTPPETLREVPAWLQEHQKRSESEQLLEQFSRRRAQ